MFAKNFSHISRALISKSKKCFTVNFPAYYFYMKAKNWQIFKLALNYL